MTRLASKLANWWQNSYDRAFFNTLAANILLLLASLTAGVLVARALGPQDRGLVAKVVFLPNIVAAVALCGTNISLAHIASAAPERRLATIALVTGTITATLASLTVVPLFKMAQPELDGVLLLTYIPFILLNHCTLNLFGLLLGKQLIATINMARLSLGLSYLSLIFVVWIYGVLTVQTTLAAITLSNLVCLAYLLIKVNPDGISTKVAELQEVFREGVPYGVSSTFQIISQQIDKGIAALLLSSADAGQYAVAWSVASVQNILLHAFGVAAFARSLSSGGASFPTKTKFTRLFWRGVLISVLSALVLGGVTYILFGSRYADSAALAMILSGAVVGCGCASIVDESAKGAGFPSVGIKGRAYGTTVTIAAYLAAALIWNVHSTYRLAFSTLCGEIVAAIASLLALRAAIKRAQLAQKETRPLDLT